MSANLAGSLDRLDGLEEMTMTGISEVRWLDKAVDLMPDSALEESR